jgi:hypothetical protein
VTLVVLDLLERAVVALVKEEEVGVVDDLIDEMVEESRPGVGALLSVGQTVEPLERLPAEGVEAEMELEQEVLLAGEVVVERCLRGSESLGDLAQRGVLGPRGRP